MSDISSLITQIRELLPKASKGKWYTGTSGMNVNMDHEKAWISFGASFSSFGYSAEDEVRSITSFIALLNPVTVSALLERIEELGKERDSATLRAYEKRLKRYRSGCACHIEEDEAGNEMLVSTCAFHKDIADRATAAESKLAEARADALEQAAKLVDENVIKDTSSGKVLSERQDGNRDGLHYAAAIRALKSGGENG